MSETTETLTCYIHPKRETQLRCNRCDKPICIKCATHTPTGYRCPECIKSQQKIFVTTKWYDHVIAFLITGAISFLGSLLTPFLGFYTIFIAMGAGFLAVWSVKKAIRNRRSPLLKFVMSVTAFTASLPFIILWILSSIQEIRTYGITVSGGILSLVWYLAYTVIITSNIYYQLRN